MEARLGCFPFELTKTARYNRADAVFLRLKANCVNSSMKSSVISQSRNARVFSEGEEDGFENKMEKRCATLVSQSTASVSRAGKNGGWNTVGLRGNGVRPDLRCTRRSSRILVKGRGRRVNSEKGSSRPCKLLNEKVPFGPNSRMNWECDRHSMKVGEDKFERCVMEIPDRMPFNPVSRS